MLTSNVPRDWLVPLCLRHIVVVVDDVGMKTRNGRPSGHLSKLMPTRFCESRERHANIWLCKNTKDNSHELCMRRTAQQHMPSRRPDYAAPVAVAVASYLNGLHGDFLDDDPVAIIDNPDVSAPL